MKLYFPLTEPRNQISNDIAVAIKKNYPIGVKSNSPAYSEHPGIQLIDEHIAEHMFQYIEYITPWKTFLANLPRGYQTKVKNDGFADGIAYRGGMILEKYEDESLIRIKKLCLPSVGLRSFLQFLVLMKRSSKKKMKI